MKKKKLIILPLFLTIFSFGINNLKQNEFNFKNSNELNTDTIETVVSGGNHTMMVANDGTSDHLYAWGRNDFGQLGLGDTTDRIEPTEITSLPENSEIIDISVGNGHSGIMIDNQGTKELYLWGDNTYGELGNGNNTNQLEPVLILTVPVGNEVLDLDLGINHTILLLNDGITEKVYSTGQNTNGQLGIGNTTNQNTFQEITTLPTGEITDIYSGYWGNFIVIDTLAFNTRLYAFGENSRGELGLGNTSDKLEPTEVTGLLTNDDEIKIMDGGYDHSGIVINNGIEDELYMTGENNQGQLGQGNNTDKTVFTKVTDSTMDGEIKSLTTSNSSTGVIVNDGSSDHIYTWGLNDNGQLGIGNNTNQTLPNEVTTNLPQNATIKSIDFYLKTSTAVISKDGKDSLYMWGRNLYGEMGINTNISSVNIPILVLETTIRLPEITLISHSTDKTSANWNYKVNDWGQNESGELWEFEDITDIIIWANGEMLSSQQIILSEPTLVDNIGSLILNDLTENTIYSNNYFTIYWGENLSETYLLNDFATGDVVIEESDLPGWEAGIIGGVVGIGIVVVIGLIIWALIMIL